MVGSLAHHWQHDFSEIGRVWGFSRIEVGEVVLLSFSPSPTLTFTKSPVTIQPLYTVQYKIQKEYLINPDFTSTQSRVVVMKATPVCRCVVAAHQLAVITYYWVRVLQAITPHHQHWGKSGQLATYKISSESSRKPLSTLSIVLHRFAHRSSLISHLKQEEIVERKK